MDAAVQDSCVRTAPHGVRFAGDVRSWWDRIPGIPVRCRTQAAEEAPRFVRPRFRLCGQEVSGALGDLGTFIPHIVGAIAVIGASPCGIFVSFGLTYLATGFLYGLPIPVQPMKAISAVVLTQTLSPQALAGSGLAIGLILLVIGASGAMAVLARIVPRALASGLQLGLGAALAWLGLKMAISLPWLGMAVAATLFALMRWPRLPGVLIVLAAGMAAGQVSGVAPPLPALEAGVHWPGLMLPTVGDIRDGFLEAALPQLPLTLTNAVIVTAALTRQMFPREVHPATETNLCLTMGVANLLTAPLGGYPLCHGAGGLAAHHRFGARSGTAPVVMGCLFLALGIAFGDQVLGIVQAIPDSVLGVLLLFSGIELARSARPGLARPRQLAVILPVAALCVIVNPAVAFLTGWLVALVVDRPNPGLPAGAIR